MNYNNNNVDDVQFFNQRLDGVRRGTLQAEVDAVQAVRKAKIKSDTVY